MAQSAILQMKRSLDNWLRARKTKLNSATLADNPLDVKAPVV